MSFIVRLGITTGSCAAAAAKAAALAALGWRVDRVVIPTPIGLRVEVRLTYARPLGSLSGEACVRKDAGDDAPNDVTHGALICAEVTLEKAGDLGGGEVSVLGGRGVGLVTQPGLPVPPGEHAINPGPRKMIREAVREALPPGYNAVVRVWVPGGEDIASRTDNPALGIVDGISILGTTGFVIPYSSAAWIGSTAVELRVIRERGFDAVAITTGRDTASTLSESLGLRPDAIVNGGHYVTPLAKVAADMGFKRVLIVAKPAKALKLSINAYMLSKEFVDGRMEALTHLLLLMGAEEGIVRRALRSAFVNEFLAWLERRDPELLGRLLKALARRVEKTLNSRVGREVIGACVNYKGTIYCGDAGWEAVSMLK